ncbi:hypothetical protein [Persicirhabdus sediminis]|uniref:Uncharacterized protein n=1 Tax=Persicirhabdus sediminis TaxID=454144 RepID=A0A8J7MD87_9BACT|nr:hypothetical protein [Persicirhabdus sediminis]MBK1790962.1 hypothetical protein [Persicirhabdus sediminis]
MSSEKPFEPKNNTADDNISQLKKELNQTHGVPDGELITRPDGTQVIKARKRKRRSKQPHKEEAKKRLKKIIIGASFLALMGIALVVGIFIILAKYNSDSFKKQSESDIAAFTDAAQVKVHRMTVTPASAKISAIEASWPANSTIQKAEFKQIATRFKLSTFFGKYWKSAELSAATGSLHLQLPTGPAAAEESKSSPFAFDFYRSFSTDIFFGPSTKGVALRKAQCTFDELYGVPQSMIQDATLQHPFWPNLQVKNVLLKHNTADNTELTGVIMPTANSGSGLINVTGKINIYADETNELELKITDFPIQQLVGDGRKLRLDRFLDGAIDAPLASLDINPRNPDTLKIEAAFESRRLNLQGLTFLRTLRRELGQSWYDKPVFDESNGTLIIENGGDVTIDNLSFTARDKLQLRGSITCSKTNELSGTLEVGLPAIENSSRPDGFSASSNGYYWAEVTLSGTVTRPKDDLFDIMGAKETPSGSQKKIPTEEQLLNPANSGFSFDELTD